MANSYDKLGHIKSQYKLGDIQRDYLFAVQFVLPPVLRQHLQVVTGDNADYNQLTMTCREASMPGVMNNPISSFWMGMEQFFNGKSQPTTTSVPFTFEEFEGIATDANGDSPYLVSPRQLFMAWSSLAHNIHSTGVGVEKRNLIGTVTVTPLRADLTEAPMGSVVLNSAWCESYQDVSLGYTNSDSIKSQISVKFDYLTYQPATSSNSQFSKIKEFIKKFGLNGDKPELVIPQGQSGPDGSVSYGDTEIVNS